jgi:hypothetical protein
MGEVARKKRPHVAAAQRLAAKFLVSDTLRDFCKALNTKELLSREVPCNQDFNLSHLFSRLFFSFS